MLAQPGSPAISPRSWPTTPPSSPARRCRPRRAAPIYLASGSTWPGSPPLTGGAPAIRTRSPHPRPATSRYDYRRWLLHEGPIKRSVVYANSALTAIDDFYLRRGLGATKIDRDDLPKQAPRALEEKSRIRWLRAVEQVTSPRDRCIALIPYYAGAPISEVVRLDTGDVRRSARKGVLRIYGKGDKVREVPNHAKLRPRLDQWLTERATWPGADTSPALFLNTKGGRLSARAAGGIIAAIAEQAALDDDPTAHVLRH